MKKLVLCFLALGIILSSCERNVSTGYVYEDEPAYTWGFAEFWGNYYQKYGNENHVLTLSLFTDSLGLDEEYNLLGFGQYLYLEDIFVASGDTILPEGDYTVSASGEPFTIAPGENLDIDGVKYPVGAQIYYLEKKSVYSTRKFIVDGEMSVSLIGSRHYVVCDFTLDDDSQLKGIFNAGLLHLDESAINENDASQAVRLNKVKIAGFPTPNRY